MKKINRIREKNKNKPLSPKDLEIDMRKQYLNLREREKQKETMMYELIVKQYLRFKFLVEIGYFRLALDMSDICNNQEKEPNLFNLPLPRCVFCQKFSECIILKAAGLEYRKIWKKNPDPRIVGVLAREAKKKWVKFLKMFLFDLVSQLEESNILEYRFSNYKLNFYFRK